MHRSQHRTWFALLVVGVVALIVAAGCAPRAAPVAGVAHADEAVHQEEEGHGDDEGVVIPADAQAKVVIGTEFAFEPAEFTVKAGHPVALTFTNEGVIEHDAVLFSADGHEVEGAHVHLHAGEMGVAVFTLEAGTYEVKCTIPGHYEAGMKGQVVAE